MKWIRSLQLCWIKLFESDASNDYQQTLEWQGLARKTNFILKVCLLKNLSYVTRCAIISILQPNMIYNMLNL